MNDCIWKRFRYSALQPTINFFFFLFLYTFYVTIITALNLICGLMSTAVTNEIVIF
jgi:hypothetical protein